MRRKHAYVYFCASYGAKINQIHDMALFSLKSGYRTKRIFLQLLADQVQMSGDIHDYGVNKS